MPQPATTTDSGTASSTTGQVSASGGSSSGSTTNQQAANATQQQTQTGQQAQSNTYLPWQSNLQQTAGNAAGNYVTAGSPPPGVTGAPPQLVQAYTDQFNQQVAPQIANAQGPGSSAIGSQLALGLEQLNANVYGTNLNAYQRAIDQAQTIGFNAVGATGNQGQATSGTSGQTANSNTNQNQNWQQAMTDLLTLTQSHDNAATSTQGTSP